MHIYVYVYIVIGERKIRILGGNVERVAECKSEAFYFAMCTICMILFNGQPCNMIHWRELGHKVHL